VFALVQERQHVKAAVERLLSGTARASSAPTVSSLAREAGINRTSLYQRHPGLIAEFKASAPDAAVTRPPRPSRASSTPPAPGSPDWNRATPRSANASVRSPCSSSK
jgi:hypothetical protein